MSADSCAKLRQILDRAKGRTIVLLGIGNELRGDDAIGHLIAQDLEAMPVEGLKAFPVGISLENSTHLVSRHGAQVLFLVDAVSDPQWPIGAWDFFPPEALGAFIHSTHSVPLSLFVSYWKKEVPDLEVHFIGINIHGTDTFRELSAELKTVRKVLTTLFRE